jgi:hypothetical protein
MYPHKVACGVCRSHSMFWGTRRRRHPHVFVVFRSLKVPKINCQSIDGTHLGILYSEGGICELTSLETAIDADRALGV